MQFSSCNKIFPNSFTACVTHGDHGLTPTPALTRHHKPGLSNGEVCVLSVFLLKKRTRNGGRRQLGPGKEVAMARKGEAGFSL